MKSYNIEVGQKLKLESYVMRVKAKDKREAEKLVKEKGFNAGFRLSSTYSGDFKPKVFDEIRFSEYVKDIKECPTCQGKGHIEA